MDTKNTVENTHPILAEIQAYGYAREQLGMALQRLDDGQFERASGDNMSERAAQELIDRAKASISVWEKIVADKAENIGIQVTVLCDYKTEVYNQ